MTTAHDERFSTPPALDPAEEKDYPKGMKPGDSGFIEALAEDGGFEFKDEVAK